MTIRNYRLFKLGILFGAFGVILGAFGAHILRGKIPESSFDSYRQAVFYQLIHTFLILFISCLDNNSKLIKLSGRFAVLGTIFFSGSIYFLSTSSLFLESQPVQIAFITPIGGSLLIISWILLLGLKKSKF